MSVMDALGNKCNWKVRLHLKSLGMPRVPEFQALRNAQATFGQYGICVEFASGQSLPNAVDRSNQCLSLTNVDVGSCTLRQDMTGQQDALFGHGSRQGVAGRHNLLLGRPSGEPRVAAGRMRLPPPGSAGLRGFGAGLAVDIGSRGWTRARAAAYEWDHHPEYGPRSPAPGTPAPAGARSHASPA